MRTGLDRFRSSGVLCHQVYNEDSFHSLLKNERRRSQRTGQSLKVLLAYVMTTEGLTARMDINVAYKLLVGLSRNLRDTDYLGWYRSGMIVGAVLTALTHDGMAEVSLQVERRCLHIFQEVISSHAR